MKFSGLQRNHPDFQLCAGDICATYGGWEFVEATEAKLTRRRSVSPGSPLEPPMTRIARLSANPDISWSIDVQEGRLVRIRECRFAPSP